MKMWKNLWWIALLISFTIIYFVVIVIIIRKFVRSTYSVVDVESYEPKTFEIVFDGIGIKPGESYKYDIKFKPDVDGEFIVTVEFDVKDSTGLEEYLTFILEDDENKILEDNFQDILEKEKMVFTINLSKDKTKMFPIIFKMPKDVENDAMGKTIDFTMIMTIEGK